MSAWKEWKAYRLDVSSTQNIFDLIKNHLVSYVDGKGLRFWVTNYFDPSKGPNPHLQFRVNVTSQEQKDTERHLDRLVEEGILLERHEAEPWNPRDDAEDRINGNREEFERTKNYVTRKGYMQVPKEEYLQSINLDTERIDELAALFGAVGEATKAFYKALPRKPIDPYIMSLTLHIILNSLTYGGPKYPSEETNIRGFPVI